MTDMSRRKKVGLKGELLLALMPTLTVLLVLAMVEVLTKQRLLFASLASSAFLIYLDPENQVNAARTLLFAQLGAAVIGFVCHAVAGPGYLSGGTAMIIAIVWMISLDAMHPPAVATALGFGLKAGDDSNLALFSVAVGMTVMLLVLQRVVLRVLRHLTPR